MPDQHVPIPTIWDRLADEFEKVFSFAQRHQDLVEPTDAEAANGWTAEALTRYLAERATGQTLAVDPHSLHRRVAKRSRYANNRYNPLKWRGRR